MNQTTLVHRLNVSIPGQKGYSIPNVPADKVEAKKARLMLTEGVTVEIGKSLPAGAVPETIRVWRKGRYTTSETRALDKKKARNTSIRAVINITTGEYFDSIVDAANAAGVRPQSVGQQINGKALTVKGNKYRHATDAEKLAKKMLPKVDVDPIGEEVDDELVEELFENV